MTTPSTRTVFAELLQKAVTEPGTISQAYRQFHSYSLGNQLLALGQCLDRGLPPGPMATYPKWKSSLCSRCGTRQRASGVATPTRHLARLVRKRKSMTFEHRLDEPPRSRCEVTAEDSRTHRVHKARHAGDMETGAIERGDTAGADVDDTTIDHRDRHRRDRAASSAARRPTLTMQSRTRSSVIRGHRRR